MNPGTPVINITWWYCSIGTSVTLAIWVNVNICQGQKVESYLCTLTCFNRIISTMELLKVPPQMKHSKNIDNWGMLKLSCRYHHLVQGDEGGGEQGGERGRGEEGEQDGRRWKQERSCRLKKITQFLEIKIIFYQDSYNCYLDWKKNIWKGERKMKKGENWRTKPYCSHQQNRLEWNYHYCKSFISDVTMLNSSYISKYMAKGIL